MEENNGFLKYVCQQYHEKRQYTVYKCLNSDQYYTYNDQSFLKFRGAACSNDPHFYQSCDKRTGGQTTNSKVLCENFICNERGSSLITSAELSAMGHRCAFSCSNTNMNKEGCGDESDASDERMVTLPSGREARHSEVCNENCDITHCEDEAFCNGFNYGVYCDYWRGIYYVPPKQICNRISQCSKREDEVDCTVTTKTTNICKHFQTGKIVPVLDYTRCTPTKKSDYSIHSSGIYCKIEDIASYQTNCSDSTKVAVTCKINSYSSTVSKYLICFDDNIAVCDDRIDSNCLKTKTCTIHKHLMCDGNADCQDRADETHEICLSKTIKTCKRRVGTKIERPLPISWLKDGVWDCVDGIDETADWQICGEGKTFRYKSSFEDKCENVFVCRTGRPGYELLRNLCDGFENCGSENDVCSASSHSQSLITTTVSSTDKGLTKQLAFCYRGLHSLETSISPCINKQFIYPEGDIFGLESHTSVILPITKQSCDYMYGEQYLYTSCIGQCKKASCPLRNIPRYEVCPNQLPDRIGTIANNEYLVFLTKSYGTIYTNRYFVCDNKVTCIDLSKVCDLVNDCEDGSDESQCINHFKCNTSGKLLPKTKQCNGRIDCPDLSDECNDQCSQMLLENSLLKGLSWFIGFLAVVANLVIIGKSIITLKRCKTTAALINRLHIILIALGDFLIGCYLFIIATYDAIIFKKGYCQRQIEWITSFECSFIGMFSTIGSQISLFSMTGLSIVRMHGIWNSMRIPGEVTLIQIVKIFAVMLSLILVSVAIALIPLLKNFENFFVNGVRFSDGLKIFIGTPSKETLLQVIQAYYGRTRDVNLKWEVLIEMVKAMFSHDFDYEDLTQKVEKVDFYGNSGVCLFKYFVQKDDPQKMFVWGILLLNFVCFVFISISYLVIGILSRRSSKNLAGSQNKRQIEERNNKMNQRIAIIITTDFLCWVPFIAVCVLHSLEVLDATPWYSIFSMVILPINSVINPLLYDDVVTNAISAPVRSLSTRIFDSGLFQSIRRWLPSAPTQELALDDLSNPVRNEDVIHVRETEQ